MGRPIVCVALLPLALGCGEKESSSVGACSECLTVEGERYCGDVGGARAQKLVEDGASLVDVRTEDEYAAGHVEGAVNVPLAELEGRLSEIDPEQPVVVYCRSGNRSGQATAVLCDAGYTVYDLGPQTAWPE